MKTIFIKLFVLTILFNLLNADSFSQVFSGPDASSKIKEAQLIKINNSRKTVDFISVSPGSGLEESNFYQWLIHDVLKPGDKTILRLVKKENDNLGFTHYHYRQFYDGLPVEYGVYHAHLKNGELQSVNGEYYGGISISSSPTLSKTSAFSKALARMNATKYKDDNSPGLSATRDKGELLIFPLNSAFHLAYKFDIYAEAPLKREYIYIDANNGEVLFEESRIHNGDAVGTALTGFSGTQTITTDSLSSANYRLKEAGRGNGIWTRNLNNGSVYSSATEFTNTNNNWNSATIDRFAYDAHYGAEKTYDYYKNTYGRNSYDDSGSVINSYVHYSTNYVNAYWDGTEMTYGDGDGTQYYPLTSLEIVGHEITHAFTEHTAALVYAGESGALNESFSDVFGNTIRFINDSAIATWYVGDQIVIPGGTGTPFRNMANPNDFMCADTYGGTYWNYGDIVHYDSGVQNFWYYLLSTGGTGVNDIGNAYTVNGIGLHDAGAIAFRNLSVYLTPNATFADARFYAVQSAVDLFGSCSNQVIQTTNAWYAVGVGGIFSNAVVAGFSESQNYFCSIPSNVIFSNNSLNATNYQWNFGDGSPLSTQQNPTHTYTSAGNYTVTLIANGSASCSSNDTLTILNCIVVTNGGGPVSNSCSPSTTVFCCGDGIINVQFGTINKTSGNASEGYRDFTCGSATTLTAGDPVMLSVSTSTTTFENVKAWIDYDNNGIFNPSTELVFTSLNKRPLHTGIINTSLNAVLNTPVRMLIMDDSFQYSTFGPCTNPQNGQAEDYTIVFQANTQPPSADFTSDFIVINVGGTVSFTDLTMHAPTSWSWTFSGGTPATSTIQNPSVVYNTLGTYQVKLKATNSFGTDSIIKTAYINVVSSVNLCSGILTSASPNGQIYDSGGPVGNYNDNENCSLLIDPGCAISVTLTFTQFTTESCCDFITIYDGTSVADPVILHASGSGIPSPVTANSGKMYIVWQSDFSGNYSGFAGQWTSVAGSSNPPVAAFSLSTSNPPIATPVQFTDQTTNLPFSWEWDFGDGYTATSENPVHSYSASGIYSVKLIAHNCVSSDTIIHTITVQGPPVISTDPVTVSATLGCNDTITIPFTIYNTGTGNLQFDINGSNTSAPVRILAMTYGVDLSTEYPNTINAINSYFTNYILDTTFTITASVLQNLLINKDVLLIPEQESGLTNYYTSLATVVQGYANAGGTVIICGSHYSGSEMLIYDLGLFTGNYATLATTGTALVYDTTDDIMNGMPLTFNLTNASFMHIITNPDKIQLASFNGYDVVTYRNIGAGKAVFICFDYYDYNNETQRIISNAVRYANDNNLPGWISIDTMNGTVLPGDSEIIYISFYSYNLPGGTYTTNIIINSNDPLHPVDSIPVTLNIGNNLCSNFVYELTSICSGNASFHDATFNTPTSWLWNFGDGTTSTLHNPVHNYLSPGNYNVQLVVCNGISCDSITKTVTITSINGPIPASCTPVTIGYCCGIGITDVTFNSINNISSDGADGYKDYSCAYSSNFIQGMTYNLNVITGTANAENTRAWIDYNNNGIFEDPQERVMTSDNILIYHNSSVHISNSAVVNTPLRMRITSDLYNFPVTSPCGNSQNGQTEDYAIFIIPNTLPPVADFTLSIVNTCTGQVNFTDATANTPTSWLWTFGDGDTSYFENPSHQYALPGTYTVTLIATNAFGIDTLFQHATVNVLNASINLTNNLFVGQTVQFSTISPGAINYLWDFGDGYLSNLHSPNHVYSATGTYIITLNISNSVCSKTIIDTIYIGIVGISQIQGLQTLDLTPNPFKDEINISYSIVSAKTISAEVYDLPGKCIGTIVKNVFQSPGKYHYTFTPPAAGIYFIKFTFNNETITKRVVKAD